MCKVVEDAADVGVQWESLDVLACSVQRVGLASQVGGHRSAPPAPLAECREGPFRVLFETAPPAAASDGKIGAGRGKLLILRRLTRDGSRDADRLLAAYSPGPPRADPLLRGAFMEKGRLLEPKSPSGQNARLRGAGLRMKPRARPWSLRVTGPRQFPLRPYTSRLNTNSGPTYPTIRGTSRTKRFARNACVVP